MVENPSKTPPLGVLASDLDGTLAKRGVINTEDREAARTLRASGILLLVVTGRNLLSLGRVAGLRDLADGIIFSSGIGRLEPSTGVVTEMGRLDAVESRIIARILRNHGEDFFYQEPVPGNHRFLWHRSRRFNPDFERRLTLYRFEARRAGDAVTEFMKPASQFVVVRPPGLGFPYGLADRLRAWSIIRQSSPIDGISAWMEILPGGIEKGSSVAGWAREHGFGPRRVFATGNDYNDVGMLEWAGRSMVVRGAPGRLTSRYPVLPPAGGGGFAAAAREAMNFLGATPV